MASVVREGSSAYDSWIGASKVCVIGAGTMGSGIAAHLANIGFEVTLLDLTQESVTDAFERARLARPPHFLLPDRAHEIRLGSITEDIELVSEADWICEAIVEKLEAKRQLFSAIAPLVRPDAMITTNTSGLQISLLAAHLDEGFRRRFMGTHFFNPPRYLKLLELIPTDETDPDAVAAMTRFLEERCARRVVLAKDTPGFIANRYGMWAMFHAIHTAERLGLTVEQVDAITGPFLGRPRSASFRLNDIVGLDVMQDIARNLVERCPHDPHLAALETPNSMVELLQRGWIGEKAGQGYYRREGREFLALDLETLEYRQRVEPVIASVQDYGRLPLGERIARTLDARDEAGEFLREHLAPTLRYADYLKAEISHSVLDFDRVMMWGFGWQAGPFAMIDAIGGSKLGQSNSPYYFDNAMRGFDGAPATIKSEPEYASLQDFPIIGEEQTYRLRDLGDGVTAISTTTKMGVITPQLVADLSALLDSDRIGAAVLTSEARSYSVGYDLNFFIGAIQAVDVRSIELELMRLQRLGELLEQRSVIAAVSGHCLGAGLELALSCSVVAAHPEAIVGLPESRVGLIPGGRGTVLTRLYNQSTARRLAEVGLVLTEGSMFSNPDLARANGILRDRDVTVYHPDRLITEAKRLALSAVPVQRPAWRIPEGPLTGMLERELEEAKAQDKLTDYDVVIGEKIKMVYAKPASYEDALERERAEFLELCFKALTQARIRHMLDTSKPLRN